MASANYPTGCQLAVILPANEFAYGIHTQRPPIQTRANRLVRESLSRGRHGAERRST